MNSSSKESKVKKLTSKEELFCNHYLTLHNATEAAKRAGYSEKTARAIGYENLTKPHIKKYIEEKTEEILSEIGVNQVRVMTEISKIAFSQMTDFAAVDEMEVFEGRGKKRKSRMVKFLNVFPTNQISPDKLCAIAELKQLDTGISIKLHDKVGALDKLARHLKLFKEGPTVTSKLKGEKGEESVVWEVTMDL